MPRHHSPLNYRVPLCISLPVVLLPRQKNSPKEDKDKKLHNPYCKIEKLTKIFHLLLFEVVCYDNNEVNPSEKDPQLCKKPHAT